PPARFIAARIAARSTTHGTPVKSCKMTRAGLKGSSPVEVLVGFQPASRVTSSTRTSNSSRLRKQLSSSTLMEKGILSKSPSPCSDRRLRRAIFTSPALDWSVEEAPNGSIDLAMALADLMRGGLRFKTLLFVYTDEGFAWHRLPKRTS